jgi:hypothetical protein
MPRCYLCTDPKRLAAYKEFAEENGWVEGCEMDIPEEFVDKLFYNVDCEEHCGNVERGTVAKLEARWHAVLKEHGVEGDF